jgi:hypothetical protein
MTRRDWDCKIRIADCGIRIAVNEGQSPLRGGDDGFSPSLVTRKKYWVYVLPEFGLRITE